MDRRGLSQDRRTVEFLADSVSKYAPAKLVMFRLV
jgi:hypothetical protein